MLLSYLAHLTIESLSYASLLTDISQCSVRFYAFARGMHDIERRKNDERDMLCKERFTTVSSRNAIYLIQLYQIMGKWCCHRKVHCGDKEQILASARPLYRS